jgi:hypothetical protein
VCLTRLRPSLQAALLAVSLLLQEAFDPLAWFVPMPQLP